jgi:hypothetical protein
MKAIFIFAQLLVIFVNISSINVPSFTISRINYINIYCNYSDIYFHFGFIGNLTTDLSEVINFEFELEDPIGVKAECSIDPNMGYPYYIYCFVDGFKYDISDQHNIFLPLENPSTNDFKFENWEEKIRVDTHILTWAANCPVKKLDYSFIFKNSPIKVSGCHGDKRKFTINASRFNNFTDLEDNNLTVYLHFREPIHRDANCSVDLDTKDTTFNCEIPVYSPKHTILFNSLEGDEINGTRHIHIRGDEVVEAIFELCEDPNNKNKNKNKKNSSNSLSYNYYISLYLLILLFL